MWLFSNIISFGADWMISSNRFSHTVTRKMVNSIGQYGPAICLIAASYTGCDRILTVFLLTLGVGLNGGQYRISHILLCIICINFHLFNAGIYSGFKINHLDITPRFAGILMAFTNCTANLAGLLAPISAGYIIEGKPTIAQWQIVFFIAAFVYIFCATFYNIFATGKRQSWDNPQNDLKDSVVAVRHPSQDSTITQRKTNETKF